MMSLFTTQVDVIGVHIQDIIHPQDCSEVAAIFQTQGNDVDQGKDVFPSVLSVHVHVHWHIL